METLEPGKLYVMTCLYRTGRNSKGKEQRVLKATPCFLVSVGRPYSYSFTLPTRVEFGRTHRFLVDGEVVDIDIDYDICNMEWRELKEEP